LPRFTVLVEEELCDLCGLCVELCPARVFEEGPGRIEAFSEKCIGCGGCVPLCPRDAITLLVDP
jgi:NAD-dependent dihydropyrimidine dehydrogenase PreA subunit